MKTEFGVGKRFGFVRGLALAINSFLVFGFYFIYRYLFEDVMPGFVGLPLAAIFLAVEFGVVKFTLWAMEKYRQSIGYRITQDCLIYGSGKTEQRYYWKDFTGADLNAVGSYRFGTVLPIRFFMGEKTVELNQYTADIYNLAGQILDRISPYAEVSQELKQQMRAMSGIL